MNSDLQQKMRGYIQEEVFTRQGDARFIPETSAWIMDFRRVCLDPGFLDVYTEIFYERFREHYPFQVGGMEVAAIPLVSAIIMKMRERGMPVNGFFIRKSRKKSGLLKMIEGKLTDDPVILVDDLINGGSTLDRQLKVLAEAKKKVAVFFTVLRFRRPEAYRKYDEQGVRIDALFSLDDFFSELGTKSLEQTKRVPAETFRVQWYFKAPDAKLEAVVPKSGVVFDDERVYVGSDRGSMFALGRSDGAIVWQERIGLGPWGSKRNKEIFSTPVLHTGRLYFGAFDGNIYCLDAATGKRLWVSFEADWIGGSATIDETTGRLYVPTLFGSRREKGGLVALDAASGKVVWRTRFASSARSTPLLVMDMQMIFVGTEQGILFALRATTGAVLWSFQSGGPIKEAAVYDKLAQVVIFSSFDGGVYALQAQTGLLVWKFDIGLANYGSPCLWQDRIYVCSLDKNLYCLKRETGEKLWTVPARARIFSSPRIYQDRLYFGANDARLYEIDPLSGKQTGFFQAVERITNPVVFDDKTGDFYLQTYANEVFCLRRNPADEKVDKE